MNTFFFPLEYFRSVEIYKSWVFLAVGCYNYGFLVLDFFGGMCKYKGGIIVVLSSSIVKRREVSVQEISRILVWKKKKVAISADE